MFEFDKFYEGLEWRQIEQSRPGVWVSVIWPLGWGGAPFQLPQGTHAGQLPANTPIYCDTLQPPETLNYLLKQQLKVKGTLPSRQNTENLLLSTLNLNN